jgi:protein-L-isoaspartate(D-aspartate) O-methyltransferase
MDVEQARQQMLGQQIRAWEVLDDSVLEVLANVRREEFVPPEYRDLAFADCPIPLDEDQVMLEPKLEGKILQSLMLKKSDSVLEIGTGSGYLTACLAQLAGEVVSVDIFADFIATAETKLATANITNVTLEHTDALQLDESRQFDAIAVTGSLPRHSALFTKLLRPGGRMFVVIGQEPIMEACLISAHSSGQSTVESLFETVVPALIGVDTPDGFVF